MAQITLQPEDIRSVSIVQACDNCRFVNRGEVDKNLQRSYFCRYNPPVAVLTPQGPISFLIPVAPNGWCGQWDQILAH